MNEPAHARLSISAQCRLLSISRSSYYYAPVPETEEMLALMRVIDAAFFLIRIPGLKCRFAYGLTGGMLMMSPET